jgi:hypothetical protein
LSGNGERAFWRDMDCFVACAPRNDATARV